MRTVFTSLLLLAAAFVSNQAVAVTSVKEITFKFSESDFKFFTNDYGELEIQSADIMATLPASDQPALPIFSRNVAIGRTQNPTSINVDVSRRLIKTEVKVALAPEVVPTSMAYSFTDNDYKAATH